MASETINRATIAISDDDAHLTFDVKPEPCNAKYCPLDDCVARKKFFNEGIDRVVCSASNANLMIRAEFDNGLMGTIARAYSGHHHLRLRPDDIRHAILIIFAKYVNWNAETMRHHFVNHSGQRDLRVVTDRFNLVNPPPGKYESIIADFCDLVRANVKNEIVEWAQTEFSTTTDVDRVVANISLMNCVEKYFNYHFEFGCGLPSVELMGTVDDWNRLREWALRLGTYDEPDLNKWSEVLQHVLGKLVEARSGTVDEDFWSRICMMNCYGSGSEKEYRGWFLVFSPFNTEGKYHLQAMDVIRARHLYGVVEDHDITSCNTVVNVKLNTGSKEYDMIFYGGLLATGCADGTVLEPCPAYIVILRRDITIDDMLYHVDKRYGNYESEIVHRMKNVVRFGHYLANAVGIPNKNMMFIANMCIETSYDPIDPFEKLYDILFEQQEFEQYFKTFGRSRQDVIDEYLASSHQ